MRRHPRERRLGLLALYLVTREAALVDGLVDLLIETVHKIGVKAERRTAAALVRDVERVHGPRSACSSTSSRRRSTCPSTPSARRSSPSRARASCVRSWLSIAPAAAGTGRCRPRCAALTPATTGACCRGSWRRSTSVPTTPLTGRCWRRSSGSVEREPRASGCCGSGTGCRSGASCPGRVATVPHRGGRTRRAHLADRLRGLRPQGAARTPARQRDLGGRRRATPQPGRGPAPGLRGASRCLTHDGLGLSRDAGAFTAALRAEMTGTLRRLDAELPWNRGVRLRHRCDRIAVGRPAPQPEPPGLEALKAEVDRRWPMTALIDLLKGERSERARHRLPRCLRHLRRAGGARSGHPAAAPAALPLRAGRPAPG